MHYLGIDIAKRKFDLAWINPKGSFIRKAFTNNSEGFASMQHWLVDKDIRQAHFCMEATGTYWEDLAAYLAQAGFTVSVINPAQIKAFSGALMALARRPVRGCCLTLAQTINSRMFVRSPLMRGWM